MEEQLEEERKGLLAPSVTKAHKHPRTTWPLWDLLGTKFLAGILQLLRHYKLLVF